MSLILRLISESTPPVTPEVRRDRETTCGQKYIVNIGNDERERLNTLLRKGKAQARQLLKARILLETHLIQCAPTARFTSGGRIHPGSCR